MPGVPTDGEGRSLGCPDLVNIEQERVHVPASLAGGSDSRCGSQPWWFRSENGGEFLSIHRSYGNLDDQGE